MGERSAAFLAGKTPKKIPIALLTPNATSTAVKFKATGNQILTRSTIPAASNSPTAPPRKLSKTDSVINCKRISLLVAPIARRIPTSRVLSVTVAYIIFIIPIPPTMREIDPIAIRTTLIIPNIELTVERISESSVMANSSSS